LAFTKMVAFTMIMVSTIKLTFYNNGGAIQFYKDGVLQ